MRYQPRWFVVAVATTLPERENLSLTPLAGSSQGTPTRQTGMTGPLLTRPRRPVVAVPPPAEPEPSARAASAPSATIFVIRFPRAGDDRRACAACARPGSRALRGARAVRPPRERRALQSLPYPECRRRYPRTARNGLAPRVAPPASSS